MALEIMQRAGKLDDPIVTQLDDELAEARVLHAMLTIAGELAEELGYPRNYVPELGFDEDWVLPDDAYRCALRQPVSMGAVFADLCQRLGIEFPPAMERALDDMASAVITSN